MWSRLCYCLSRVCERERDGKDRLCTTGFASVICGANASNGVCHMLVHAMLTSGGSVWFGWRFWLYLPGATRVYLTVCSSYRCSHKLAKTLTIRPDYCPSPVACCRWAVIFLFFGLIAKTAKQAKCVGCLSASLALLDYLTLLIPIISCYNLQYFKMHICNIDTHFCCGARPGFRTKRH